MIEDGSGRDFETERERERERERKKESKKEKTRRSAGVRSTTQDTNRHTEQ